MLAALTDYRSGSWSLRKVATAHSLPYSTLRHCVQGCKTCSDGHSSQKLLSQVQEDVLVSWCEYQASMAKPLMCTTLREHVRLLSSIVPSDIWVRCFLCRHATTIIAAKARGLDPKWAKVFNPLTVAGHFQLLGKVLRHTRSSRSMSTMLMRRDCSWEGGRRTSPPSLFSARETSVRECCSLYGEFHDLRYGLFSFFLDKN